MTGTDRRELAAVFTGGAIGGLVRVWLGTTLHQAAGCWPWLTFAINVSGAATLAYLATRLGERLPQATYRRPLLATGFCGAYTTFSTMQVEIVKLADAGRPGLAASYAAASLTAGYLAIWLTTALVRRSRAVW